MVEALLIYPFVLNHLPTTDHGIQFCAPKEDVLEKMMYKYGNLVNPNSTVDGAWYVLNPLVLVTFGSGPTGKRSIRSY